MNVVGWPPAGVAANWWGRVIPIGPTIWRQHPPPSAVEDFRFDQSVPQRANRMADPFTARLIQHFYGYTITYSSEISRLKPTESTQ